MSPKTNAKDPWIAPEDIRIPDFIICGAMKCGTTSLHYMLNEHPEIFIPEKELHFFDMDEVVQHPNYNYFDNGKWYTHNPETAPETYWSWYASQFEDASKDQLLGEDSTIYINSEKAAQRIALQEKKVKLVVMLRNPTSRSYSQYWHMLWSGRATYDFEKTIRYAPHSVLDRSLYKDYLERFLRHVPRKHVMIVILEEFLKDTRADLEKVCRHIGVDEKLLPEGAENIHVNQALAPRWPALQLWMNRIFREQGNIHYTDFLPESADSQGRKRNRKPFNLPHRIHRKINPLQKKKPPKIHPETKRFLDEYFKSRLEGINELVGKDVMSIWFGE